jgi:hypothetical protein
LKGILKMSDYLKGFFMGIIICLLIVGVYLCKMNFQYSESHYKDLQQQIERLK